MIDLTGERALEREKDRLETSAILAWAVIEGILRRCEDVATGTLTPVEAISAIVRLATNAKLIRP